jgi:hypothetical protein
MKDEVGRMKMVAGGWPKVAGEPGSGEGKNPN